MDGEPGSVVSPSKRKKKQADEVSSIDTASIADSSSIYDDDVSEADTAATSVDDGLPHPRVGLYTILARAVLLLTYPSLSNPDENSLSEHQRNGKRS